MSFQTVPKRRQHPIFDNHRRNASSPAPTKASGPKISIFSQQMEKESKPVVRDRTQKNDASQRQQPSPPPPPQQIASNGNGGPKISLTSKVMETEYISVRTSNPPKKSISVKGCLIPQRGVRPRLSTRCPVTQKQLFHQDDQDSMATPETIDTSSSTEEHDNPTIISIRSNSSSPKSQSMFAHLTTLIVNYQKMVAELEGLVQSAGSSPESQWRTRILIRSAQDADRDIPTRLYQLDPPNSRAQVALRKLHRDFGRTHQHYLNVLQAYSKQQQVEVSFLNRNATAIESKEEFFDRAMREREQEVQEIHDKMNKVNTIYRDLATLVDGQQEKIDKLAEGTEESKANTRQGLHSIQNGFFGMCVPLDAASLEKTETVRQENEKGWSMPFEALKGDIRSVQEDVFKFGQELMDDLQHKMVEGRLSGCSQAFDCHEATNELS